MKFNNSKLSIGILYIGAIVLLSSLGLYSNLAESITSNYGNNLFVAYSYIAILLITTMPLDILSSKKLNADNDSGIRKIVISNIILFIFFIVFTTFLFFLYNLQSPLVALISSIFIQLFLLILQGLVAQYCFNSSEESHAGSTLLILADSPSYMTMNILRTIGGTKILVPNHWRKEDQRNYNFHLERFELIKNSRIDLKSILYGILINSILFTLIYSYFLNSTISATYFIIHVTLLSNLTSFIFILILPKISQNGIANIDSIMKDKDMVLFKQNLEIFESNQDKNNHRGKLIETIFYPIPSIKTRIDQKNSIGFGLPNISRLIIFLASFSLSLIFKGVHGNAGKPENWLFPPSE